ncbi:triphosphoribosyl-dephospho-CoA synthase [Massilia forsythiae]|uniref:Probable 2-(5''-triphosphoribosyl)-3'-dephosphocoenzyme-A synthase n=2 Tax=Massilia forsythiae TaxID=2728020 RepID=A0A7Z2ZVG9_9BURK|nr:triphosphoribosyl-dephospho-CoA synthase [Massilia forsythiae]QJE03504.1 triphosphoribosyl-dephospho-CoA synthase [Massilia forsythiae]
MVTASGAGTARSAPADALAERLADLAVAALVDEALLTPKPGLVDLRGGGAHADMRWMLMCRSAWALRPAFLDMARAGAAVDDLPALRRRIGAIGRAAEGAMMAATGGVNTHRGAIWALGLLVTAAARYALHGAANGAGPARETTATKTAMHDTATGIARLAGRLARIDDPGAPAHTGNKGELACRVHGVGGARGQARAGFPAVTGHALPMLRSARARGDAEPQARVNALLAVMAGLDDTCLLARGGAAALHAAQTGARRVLARGGMAAPNGRRAFAALEARLRRLHVSPGGAADLLAAALLLDRLDTARIDAAGRRTYPGREREVDDDDWQARARREEAHGEPCNDEQRGTRLSGASATTGSLLG